MGNLNEAEEKSHYPHLRVHLRGDKLLCLRIRKILYFLFVDTTITR